MRSLDQILQGRSLLEAFFERTLSPGLFFTREHSQLIFRPLEEETVTWEIFRGQLLDVRHTREQQTFLTHHVRIKSPDGNSDPILTLRLFPATAHQPPSTLHVTRWLHLRVWEAFDDNGAIGSRETERWVEELVGTASLAEFNHPDSLMKELRLLVFHAFVGLSRLPLNSVEAPLPGFSLGIIGFFPSFVEGEKCVSDPSRMLDRLFEPHESSPLEQSKLLELFLRAAAAAELSAGAVAFAGRLREQRQTDEAPGRRIRRMFNGTSLTPYTDFVEKTLTFAQHLLENAALSRESYASVLLSLVRQTVYHLTAYDLITFHHQGANYPDTLLLDSLLDAVCNLAKTHPLLFVLSTDGDSASILRTRSRRRALILGWWMHRFLKGLPVPDEPTSPGENARILPPPHRRIPEEQLLQRGRRKRILYSESQIDWPSHQVLLERCFAELADPQMLLEFGTALYLDRPFGATKPPGSLDLTPLLSYDLFSRSIARERLSRIAKFDPQMETNSTLPEALKNLEALQVSGLPVPRPVSSGMSLRLKDCWCVADDFIVMRPTRETIRQLRALFDWADAPTPLCDWYERGLQPVPIPGSSPGEPTRIAFFNSGWNLQFDCMVAAEKGFARRGPLELPMPGLMANHDGSMVTIRAILPD